jgi:hypothetical protein
MLPEPAADVDDAVGAWHARAPQRVEQRREEPAHALALPELLGGPLQLVVRAEQNGVDEARVEHAAPVRPERHDAYRRAHAVALELGHDLVTVDGEALERRGIVGDDEVGDLGAVVRPRHDSSRDAGSAHGEGGGGPASSEVSST